MLLLEYECSLLKDLIPRYYANEKISTDYKFCDFDGVRYEIKLEKKAERILVQVFLPCAKEVAEHGGDELYERVYGSLKVDPTEGYTHAIGLPLDEKDSKKIDEYVRLAATLKANLISAPFLWVAERWEAKESFAPFEIPYRKETSESFFLCPTPTGVSCVFSIKFSDPMDKVIGDVFLQELVSCRTKIAQAPPVSVSNTPPGDLESFTFPDSAKQPTKIKDGKGGERNIYQYGFVTFSLLAPQLSAANRQKTGYYVPMFRNHIHYHIKCSKGFMHQVMRRKTSEFLKLLDEARPEPKQKVKRTVTGKVIQ